MSVTRHCFHVINDNVIKKLTKGVSSCIKKCMYLQMQRSKLYDCWMLSLKFLYLYMLIIENTKWNPIDAITKSFHCNKLNFLPDKNLILKLTMFISSQPCWFLCVIYLASQVLFERKSYLSTSSSIKHNVTCLCIRASLNIHV